MTHLLLVIIYLAFVSLGLPDALLGSAWPVMQPELDVPVSWAGVIFFLISLGTVISSLQSHRLTRRLGTGKVTALSVALTALALLGFSLSRRFWMLCLWAIPYGLGAGSVDACLNNYVALHYKSRHMSWLHCMWGVGATLGPAIMGQALTRGLGWTGGYGIVSLLQILLTGFLFLSLPLWKENSRQTDTGSGEKSLSLKQVTRLPGVPEVMLCFFCYCAVEQTVGLWASSYLALHKQVPADTAAGLGSLFFLGITVGRFLSGFVTIRLRDRQMVWLGLALLGLGILALLLPLGQNVGLAGLVLVGLGCAPIYPALIHATPAYFGAQHSQAVIGVQMASAYLGNCLMPPAFGLLARALSPALLPWYLLVLLGMMALCHRGLLKKAGAGRV